MGVGPRSIDRSVGKQVKAYRLARKIEAIDISNLLQVSPAEYTKLEDGLSRFEPAQLRIVAQYLGVNVSSLLAGVVFENRGPKVDEDDDAFRTRRSREAASVVSLDRFVSRLNPRDRSDD